MDRDSVLLYDTTLRDGTQRRGVSLTLNDKLRIARLLDDFGMAYIEGGWPGANPKDSEFFQMIRETPLSRARLVAFASTRRAKLRAEEDPTLKALIEAETPAVAMFGKSWTLHVTEALRTTLEQNLAMIFDSVAYMKQCGKEVIYDAEHFFDGYRADPEYAIKTIKAAASAGADWIVLCDTNGGSLPSWVTRVIQEVKQEMDVPLGIHTHNDAELAVANAIAAVEVGCRQVQGTVNGYGERCGNANLISVAAALELKMGIRCLPEGSLARLTELSRQVSEIANLDPDTQAPYVGVSAFCHKAGMHVAAVEKLAESYEHIRPELVGNRRQVLLSELSGRGNVRIRASEMGVEVKGHEAEFLEKIKSLEREGYEFENAEGSFELWVRRTEDGYEPPFRVIDVMVVSERRNVEVLTVEAVVKLQVGDEIVHTAAEGGGPVHALDRALRKALSPYYPGLERVRLTDYKVRILDPKQATSATTRVLIEAASNGERWSTVGVDENIIEASFLALCDSLELFVLRERAKTK